MSLQRDIWAPQVFRVHAPLDFAIILMSTVKYVVSLHPIAQ